MERFHGSSFDRVGQKVTAVVTCLVIIVDKKKKVVKKTYDAEQKAVLNTSQG